MYAILKKSKFNASETQCLTFGGYLDRGSTQWFLFGRRVLVLTLSKIAHKTLSS